MKSMSSGSGLRNVLAIASAPRSATSRRRISASTSLRSLSMPGLVLVLDQPLLERGHAAVGLVLRGLHHALEHAVEIEVAQGPVEVIRAADRTARLHAGEAGTAWRGEGRIIASSAFISAL